MQQHQIPGELWETDSMVTRLNTILDEKFGVTDLALSNITAVDYQVNFDMEKINSNHLDFEAIKKVSVDFLTEAGRRNVRSGCSAYWRSSDSTRELRR